VSAILKFRLSIGICVFLPMTASAYTAAELSAVRSEREKKILKIREEQILEYRDALSRRLPQNRQVDLYVRLSELYMELYQQTFLEEAAVHEKKIAAGEKVRFIDRSVSKSILQKGIDACEEVVRSRYLHAKLDQVYYFLGVYYDELDDEGRSVGAFRSLVERFPRSPYVPESLRILGESAYQKQDFRRAKQYFDLALPKYTAQNRGKLLHRKAWTEYRLKLYPQAVETLKKFLSESTGSSSDYIVLREEAYRDMATFLAESYNPKAALAALVSAGAEGSDFYRGVEALALQYERNARPDDACAVLEEYLSSGPKDEKTVQEAKLRLFEISVKSNVYKARGVDGLVGLVFQKGSESDLRLQAAVSKVKNQAIKEHERYRKTSDFSALKNSEILYFNYLKLIARNGLKKQEQNEISMYLAEVLALQGKFGEAGAIYRQVTTSGDVRLSEQAAKLWLSSLSEALKKNSKNLTIAKAFEEAAIFVAEERRKKPEGLQAALSLAQLYAAVPNAYDRANTYITQIFLDRPDSPQAHVAAKLRVQLLSDELKSKQTESPSLIQAKVKRELNEILDIKPIMARDAKFHSGELRESIDSLSRDLELSDLKGLVASKDYQGAARTFERLAGSAKSVKEKDTAYQSAVTQFSEAGDFINAHKTLMKWSQSLPQSVVFRESARTTATRAMIVGDFLSAGELFEMLGNANDPSALQLAGRLFEGASDLTRAASVFSHYLNKFSNSVERGEVGLSLGQWYEYSTKDTKAIQAYEGCTREKSMFAAECGVRIAELYSKLALPEKSKAWMEKTASLKSSSPWVGYARFQLAKAKEARQQFRFPLRLPEDKLKLALSERVKYIEQLNLDYRPVIESAGPWAVAGLFQVGKTVLEFADEIENISPPKSGGAAFKELLKSISQPLRARAMESFQTGFQKSMRDELFSPIIPELLFSLWSGTGKGVLLLQGPRDRYRLSGEASDGSESGSMELALEKVRKALIRNAKDSGAWIDYGNLLWGSGKPLLAKIAYERSLSLNPRAAAALNNRGVISLSGYGQEDWIRTLEADAFFKEALRRDDLFLAARFNRASLLSYYRLFEKSESLWAQVNAVVQDEDALDGLAMAETFRGDFARGDALMSKAEARGASQERFSRSLYRAVRAIGLEKDRAGCLRQIDKMAINVRAGFEKTARDLIAKACSQGGSP